LITKKTKNTQKPGSHSHSTGLGGNKSTRKYVVTCVLENLGTISDILNYRTYKTIVNNTAKSGYRSDLRAHAVARASAIRKSQTPKKDLPESKLRGAKAKKAAAEKEE
jgi:large subunit ribosomal protein L28e